jgi:hypothetical protein
MNKELNKACKKAIDLSKALQCEVLVIRSIAKPYQFKTWGESNSIVPEGFLPYVSYKNGLCYRESDNKGNLLLPF